MSTTAPITFHATFASAPRACASTPCNYRTTGLKRIAVLNLLSVGLLFLICAPFALAIRFELLKPRISGHILAAIYLLWSIEYGPSRLLAPRAPSVSNGRPTPRPSSKALL